MFNTELRNLLTLTVPTVEFMLKGEVNRQILKFSREVNL